MMINEQKILAIDIGSNAMRASYACFDESKDLEIIESRRFPLRLGDDVFSRGKLSRESFEKSAEAFRELADLIHRENIDHVRAVATSALRNSQNGQEFIDYIDALTGIQIEIIPGDVEAELIKKAVSSVIDLNNKIALLIDIGGGSTEFTLTQNNKVIYSKSFECGTVRLLQYKNIGKQNLFIQDTVDRVIKDINEILKGKKIELCIGTGGNLKRMGKLRQSFFKRSSHKILEIELAAISAEVSRLNLAQRMNYLSMRKDRADVIVPAIRIIESILTKLELKEILLPTIGLKEGLMIDSFDEIPRNILLQ